MPRQDFADQLRSVYPSATASIMLETPALSQASEMTPQTARTATGSSPRKTERVRSKVACQTCNRRKVRCDVTQTGVPCSNCQYEATVCEVLPRKKHRPRRPRATVHSGDAEPRSTRQDYDDRYASISRGECILPDDSPASYIGDKRGPRYSVYDLCHSETPQEALPLRTSSHLPNNTIHKPHEVELIRAEGGFETFSKEKTDSILDFYFRHVHFLLPVVDASFILNEYQNNGFQNINPLLMWSMFLAAANFVDDEALRNVGFSSRKAMKTAMYTRAKCLYDLDRGTDKLTLIQSVLLMSFWYTDPQDHTGAWYWVGIAISLAQSVGIHRDPHFINSIIPAQFHPLSRRIWWACVIRDRWLSLAKGRPMRVHDEDYDVFMPCAQDVADEIANIKSEIRTKFVPHHSDTLAEIWVYFVKTSIILGQVLRMHYRVKGLKPDTHDIEKIATDLDAYKQPELQPEATDELVLIHRYHWDIFYQSTIVILYRQYLINPAEIPVDAGALWLKAIQSRARAAASATNMILEKIMQIGALNYVKPMIITALIPTMQVHLSDCRANDPVQSGLASNKLHLCMIFLENISNTYWSAGVMFRLFERAQHILRNMKRRNEMHKTANLTSQRSSNLSFPGNLVGTRETRTASGLREPESLVPVAAPLIWLNEEDVQHGSMNLNAIDQLLNPEFSLPDDDYSALFPAVMFGKADQSHADHTIDTINLFDNA